MKKPNCKICKGEGWVCENHPLTAWLGGTGCKRCGGAGMPCACNTANPPWNFSSEGDMKTFADQCLEQAEKATPGPWKFYPADDNDDWEILNSQFTFVKQDDSGVPVSKEDGEFIAASRMMVPELATRLKRACEALRDANEKFNNLTPYNQIHNGWLKLADELEAPLESEEK